MSRKARKNLVGDWNGENNDGGDRSGASARAVAAGSAAKVAARRAFLEHYTPQKMEAAVVATVRPHMIVAVLEVAFTAATSDKSLAHVYFLFANWCIQTRGGFDAASDMNQDLFDAFRVGYLKHYGSSSDSTHMSNLKCLQRKRRNVKGRSRVPATPPLSQRQWMSLLKAASEAGPLSGDAKTLLVLAGGLGMSPGEVAACTGSWLHRQGNRTSVTIIDKNLGTREIPIYGADAEWMRTRAATTGSNHMFRPGVEKRSNAVCGFVARMGRAHGEFIGFTATQARHMWLMNLMTSAVPFHIVCAMAGMKGDSNLASDLIAHAPAVAISDMRYHLEPTRLSIENDHTQGTKS